MYRGSRQVKPVVRTPAVPAGKDISAQTRFSQHAPCPFQERNPRRSQRGAPVQSSCRGVGAAAAQPRAASWGVVAAAARGAPGATMSSDESSEPEDDSFVDEVEQAKRQDGAVSIRALQAGVIRAGVELDSEAVGKLGIGEVFEVLEEATTSDGNSRLRMERGWVWQAAAAPPQPVDEIDEEEDSDSEEGEPSGTISEGVPPSASKSLGLSPRDAPNGRLRTLDFRCLPPTKWTVEHCVAWAEASFQWSVRLLPCTLQRAERLLSCVACRQGSGRGSRTAVGEAMRAAQLNGEDKHPCLRVRIAVLNRWALPQEPS